MNTAELRYVRDWVCALHAEKKLVQECQFMCAPHDLSIQNAKLIAAEAY